MKHCFASLVLVIVTTTLCQAQPKKIVVLGSSSAFGLGATPIDSSWVNLSRDYYEGLGLVDTIIDLGNPGATSFAALPTGTTIPPQYLAMMDTVDLQRNITYALSLSPDLVIISFPTNDIGQDIPLAIYLQNLRTIYNAATNAGAICYVASTQPRNGFNAPEAANLIAGRDSILLEFPSFGLNFFDPLVDPANPSSAQFAPSLTTDGTHPDNAGHQLLFQVVKNNVNLAGTPLPLSLSDWTAARTSDGILLRWTAYDDPDGGTFDVQRSGDGIHFASIYTTTAVLSTKSTPYSYTDKTSLSGDNYYRLKIQEHGAITWSPVVRIGAIQQTLIDRVFSPAPGSLIVQLSQDRSGPITMTVLTAAGEAIGTHTTQAAGMSSAIMLTLPPISTGLYYLRIITADGKQAVKSFWYGRN